MDDEAFEFLQIGDLENCSKVEGVDAEPRKLSVESVYVREVTQTYY